MTSQLQLINIITLLLLLFLLLLLLLLLLLCLSVRLSVCPSVRKEQLGSHWTDFHAIWYLSIFEIWRKNSTCIKILQKRWVRYMKTNIYVAYFFLGLEMFQMKL